MAFRFSMESVLKHRKRQEEVAQREYMECHAIVEDCLRGIETMYKSIDESRTSIAAAERSGRNLDLHFIRSTEAFIEGQKSRIHKERMKARELIRQLEEKEEVLLQRLHERKIMEKLKDRRFVEYKERIARIEQKELDDLTNARMAGGRG
jgi:flagellar protein FliJ